MTTQHSDGLPAALAAIQELCEQGDCRAEYEACDRALGEFPASPELWALRASHLRLSGRGDDAQIALVRALELGPDCALVWAAQADIAAFEARFDDALDSAERALQIDAQDPWVLERCAAVQSVAGDEDTALGLSARLCEISPESPSARTQHIAMLRSAGRTREAESLLAESEAKWPDSPLIAVLRASKLMAVGRLSDAADILRRAAEHVSGNPVFWAGLAEALARLRRFPEAEEAVNRAFEINPCAHLAMIVMARICMARGRTREAAEWHRRAMEAKPVMRIVTALRAANKASRLGDWRQALRIADTAIAHVKPGSDWAAREIRARALVGLRRLDEAQHEIEVVAGYGRRTPSTVEISAAICEVRGNADGAAAILRAGLSQWPTAGTLRAKLIRILHAARTSEGETTLIEEAYDNLPQAPRDFVALLQAVHDSKHYDDFARLCTIAEERFPGMPELRLIDAVERLRVGDPKGARQCVQGLPPEWQAVGKKIKRASYFIGFLKSIAEFITRRKSSQPPAGTGGS